VKALKIGTNNGISIIDLQEPLHKTLQEELGGYFEIVMPKGLIHPYVMIVDDEGLLKELPLNPIGTYLYRAGRRLPPIAGDAIIMALQEGPDGMDVVGLSDKEVVALKKMFRSIAMAMKKPLSAVTE
jgi:hypothetical protein